MPPSDRIVREIHVDASPSVVFEFFVDPSKLTRWLAVEATLDPRPGGECVQVHAPFGPDGDRFHMQGRFIAVDAPNRVVFTWGFVEPHVGIPVASTTVEVTLRAVRGGTHVRLEHRGLSGGQLEEHDKGWADMLDRMARAAVGERQNRAPKEDTTMDVMEHEVWLDADGDRVFAALTTADGLDQWWGPVLNAEARVGSVVEFEHGLGAPLRMEITDLVPGERVVWNCVSEFDDPGNPASEWTGQTLTWEVRPRDTVELLGTKREVTVLRLRVTGWPQPSRWYGFCNTAWGETLATKIKPSCETH